MKVYNNLKISKNHKNSVVAIGNFDGLHIGHQKVIYQAKKKAVKSKLPLGIISFEPMPLMFFNRKIKNHRINSLSQKKFFLKKLKLNFLIIIRFNKKFSKLSAKEFVKKIIFKAAKCKFLFVSKNFKFGFKREGDINTLIRLSNLFNFKTVIITPLKKKFKTISSTIIRKKISSGKILEANQLLQRNWSICGKVIRGEKRGSKIGYPTCNINIKDYVIPKLGVYAVLVKTSKFTRKGIANIGFRPTFGKKKLLLETNIFGIKQNLYNKDIEIKFKKFIRPEKKFKNLEQLKKQIKIDIKKAKNV